MEARLFDPQHLQALCRRYGLEPSKRYGQNYLIDPQVVAAIVEKSGVGPGDTVVEIGPGFGTLTMALAAAAKEVRAFEIEKKLEPYWSNVIKKYPNISLVWGNALYQLADFPLPDRYQVVANLPYQITSPLIRTLLELPRQPVAMTLMVQKEVGERICAAPGDMSLLAVAVQYYAAPQYLFTVPRNSFWPVPGVDSAVIRLEPLQQYRADVDSRFFGLVKAGFASRRKILARNLEQALGQEARPRITEALARVGASPAARAQELSVGAWRQLAASLG